MKDACHHRVPHNILARQMYDADTFNALEPVNRIRETRRLVVRLQGVEGVGIMHLSGKDVVRHPVVARILQAYESGS